MNHGTAARWICLLLVSLGVTRAGGETISFSDDFDRPDGLTLGPPWDESFGTQSFGVENNAAILDNDLGQASGGFALVSGFTVDASTGFAVDVDMTRIAPGGRWFGSIVFAYEDSANFWELRLRSDPGAIFLADLIQTAAGVEQPTTSTWDFAGTLSGGPLHLDVDYDGADLSVSVNHLNGFNAGGTVTQVDTVTVADGLVGLRSRAGERVYEWDNFSVQYEDLEIDEVEVGGVTGLAFASETGTTYRLDATPDLVNTNDFSSTGAFVEGTGGTVTLFDPAGFSTGRIYRVRGSR